MEKRGKSSLNPLATTGSCKLYPKQHQAGAALCAGLARPAPQKGGLRRAATRDPDRWLFFNRTRLTRMLAKKCPETHVPGRFLTFRFPSALIRRILQRVFFNQLLRQLGRRQVDFVVNDERGHADGVLFTHGRMGLRRIADFHKRAQGRDARSDVDINKLDLILAKNLFDRAAAPSMRIAVQCYLMHNAPPLLLIIKIKFSFIIVYLNVYVKPLRRPALRRQNTYAMLSQTLIF